MSELQPGMLAMIYGLNRDTEFNGWLVSLDHQVTPENIDDYFETSLGDWIVEHHGEIVFGTFRPQNLLPIKPEADPLDVTETQELHA